MINPMDLTGKQILVTGASAGIGKETSIQLSKLGAKVIMIARQEERLKETFNLLEGNGHHYYIFDLERISEIEDLINYIVKSCGSFDGFVHCAGIAPMRPLSMTKYENILNAMNINFFSFIEITRCITKKSSFKLGGSIVGISSIASVKGQKSKLSYNASKAAMDAAIRCIACELQNKKIRINSVMPGWVATDMYTSFIDRHGDSNESGEMLKRQILGVSAPYEIANTVAFLLSDATKTITGTSLVIDGGILQG